MIQLKGSRKTARLTSVKVIESSTPIVLVNGRSYPLTDFLAQKLVETVTHSVAVTIIGGGTEARLDLVRKVLQRGSEVYFPYLRNTDSRRKYVKRYGGKGARARYQKSYR